MWFLLPRWIAGVGEGNANLNQRKAVGDTLTVLIELIIKQKE